MAPPNNIVNAVQETKDPRYFERRIHDGLKCFAHDGFRPPTYQDWAGFAAKNGRILPKALVWIDIGLRWMGTSEAYISEYKNQVLEKFGSPAQRAEAAQQKLTESWLPYHLARAPRLAGPESAGPGKTRIFTIYWDHCWEFREQPIDDDGNLLPPPRKATKPKTKTKTKTQTNTKKKAPIVLAVTAPSSDEEGDDDDGIETIVDNIAELDALVQSVPGHQETYQFMMSGGL